MAMWVILAFTAYLRPREAMELQRADLIPPNPQVSRYWSLLICPSERGSRTKVGDQDDSVTLDSSVLPWLPEMMKVLKGGKSRMVWQFGYPQLAREFKLAAQAVGLPKT
eukprot:7388728-Karenia_brevis.AAC.1